MKTSGNRVLIFDTTLRDGEQSPGASLNHRDKLEIAGQLVKLGVDIIEAGFPIASPEDFIAVRDVAGMVKGASVCGLARCVRADIERCAEAVCVARKPRIHIFLATSAIHRKFKLKKAKREILKQAVAHVKYALRFCGDVEFSPEDASRTEPDFLADVVGAVIDAGAGTVNIPDTVGYAAPVQFGELIGGLFERVANIGDAVISVHCHNDLGLAVANSLSAVRNGARAIECTVNGLGERAGNCALEEVVMALKTRHDVYGFETGIDTREILKTSRLVSQLTGIAVQRNKAIVGANAFAHEAGVHQDGVLKERSTYEIMSAEEVGIGNVELVLGKHSGRHGLRHRLGALGIKLPGKDFERVYRRFIELADRKKEVYDDDLLMLAREEGEHESPVYSLDYMQVTTGTGMIPTAAVRLRKGSRTMGDAMSGDGPIDAVFNCIDRITGVDGRLTDFSVQAVTVGQDAMGEASVTVECGKKVLNGKAASTDIVEAGAKAYLSCINRFLCWSEGARGAAKRGGARARGKRVLGGARGRAGGASWK